jgi:hypothetical protein
MSDATSSSSAVGVATASVITIAQPPNNANVHGNGTFTTFGVWDATKVDNAKAEVLKASDLSHLKDGAPITPPPIYKWAFKFEGLPINIALILKVRGYKGATFVGSDQVNITCVV